MKTQLTKKQQWFYILSDSAFISAKVSINFEPGLQVCRNLLHIYAPKNDNAG